MTRYSKNGGRGVAWLARALATFYAISYRLLLPTMWSMRFRSPDRMSRTPLAASKSFRKLVTSLVSDVFATSPLNKRMSRMKVRGIGHDGSGDDVAGVSMVGISPLRPESIADSNRVGVSQLVAGY